MGAGSQRPFQGLPVGPDALAAVEPVGWLYGNAAATAVACGTALPLAGDVAAFSHIRAFARSPDGKTAARVVPCGTFLDWLRDVGDPAGDAAIALARIAEPRLSFAGLDVNGGAPRVMGILNVTRDSFYAGSRVASVDDACDRARRMLDAGADIIDVGGESTRPGARPSEVQEELDRVLPVAERLSADGAVVSVDTRRAAVMRAALASGARIVNDVSALTHDDDALGVVRDSQCDVILMHMQGRPATMQRAPDYENVVLDVYEYLEQRVAQCEAAGIPRRLICVDPGIGFGKTPLHNAALLSSLGILHGIGCTVLVGASRKSFIAAWSGDEPAEARLPGSIAAVCSAAMAGTHIVRVHDVAETKQALRIWRAARPA